MYIYTAFQSQITWGQDAVEVWGKGKRAVEAPAGSRGGVPRETGGRTPWGNPHLGADIQKSPALLQCPTFSPFPALRREGQRERRGGGRPRTAGYFSGVGVAETRLGKPAETIAQCCFIRSFQAGTPGEEAGRAQEGGPMWGPCLMIPPVKVFPFIVLLQPAWTEDTTEGAGGGLR